MMHSGGGVQQTIRLFLLIISTVLLPFVVVAVVLFFPRIRSGLLERLGGGAWRTIPRSAQGRIWLHAASVGEVGGLIPVLRELKSRYPKTEVLVTTTSLTGRKSVMESGLADAVCLLPFDHPLLLRSSIKRVSPLVCLIFETEIWPALYFELGRSACDLVVVNGRISDYSFPQYQRLRFFQKYILCVLTHVFAQTSVDRDRFVALGVPPSRVSVAGSTKYEQEIEMEEESVRRERAQALGLCFGAPCLVAGSVREHEDAVVLDSYRSLLEEFPDFQLVVAPRHPERFDAVAKLLEERGLQFNRRSEGDARDPAPVMLLDTMGELRACYGLGSLAFVGGSLVDIGGHNPLEPAAYSIPVLFGPYVSTVRDATAALMAADAGGMVRDKAELTAAMRAYLSDEAVRVSAGKAAHEVWRSNQGASESLFAFLEAQNVLS